MNLHFFTIKHLKRLLSFSRVVFLCAFYALIIFCKHPRRNSKRGEGANIEPSKFRPLLLGTLCRLRGETSPPPLKSPFSPPLRSPPPIHLRLHFLLVRDEGHPQPFENLPRRNFFLSWVERRETTVTFFSSRAKKSSPCMHRHAATPPLKLI